MGRLHAVLAEGNFGKADDILHQLIGSSGIHGFMDLSRQARLVHEACVKGELSLSSGSYQRLVDLAAQIIASESH
jgi:hypothetical protein